MKNQKSIVLKRLIFLLMLVAFACTVQAQKDEHAKGRITGSVVDSASHHPLEYVTITLSEKDNKKVINGSTTDTTGFFEITNVAPGTYTVVAEFIGYKKHTFSDVVIKQDELIKLNPIFLYASGSTLQKVTVSTQARVIENKIDKLVFNADKDITSQTGVATDVLRKVPQVTVGVDGNVELAGNAGIRFLINGKPSAAFGSNIADVLQSIPANQIKSIEVITNPGARYDAQGIGGIINIILKKSNAQGINGNLSITGGTRTENGSFNFNARKGKLAVNAFISGNTRLRASTPSFADRTTADTSANTRAYLHQDGVSQISRKGFQTGLGFEWSMTDKNNLSGAVTYNHFGNDGSGYTNQLLTVKDGSSQSNILSQIQSINNIDNTFLFKNIDANLNYKRTFTKEDQELNISVNSSFGNNKITALNNQFLLPANDRYYSSNSLNHGTENEHELLVDYTQPISKDVMLGVGSKVNFMDINTTSDVSNLDKASNTYLANPFLNNNLQYHQKVYAGYAELTFPVGKLFDAKMGSRYERTEIDAFYSNAQIQQKIPGYNTLVPSIYFSKKIGKDQVKLSFSRRIGRPEYNDLNPFVNTSDPKNFTTGNSNLVPEASNRYELSYNKDVGKIGSFMINFFYRLNQQDIQPFITYYPLYKVGDSVYTQVNVSSRQNIGTEKNVGANLFADLHLVSKMSIRTNLFFFHRNIINAIDKGYNTSSFNYRLNLNTSYQFSPTLAGEFFGNFNSPRNEAQGKYPSFTTYSFAVRKLFWNKNASIAITTTNPFKDAVDQRTTLSGPNFMVDGQRSIPFRSVGINFTWKFGHLEFKKEKEPTDNTVPAE